jgi:hypothetical protein
MGACLMATKKCILVLERRAAFFFLSFVWSCKRLDSDCRIAFCIHIERRACVAHAIIAVLCYNTRGVCVFVGCLGISIAPSSRWWPVALTFCLTRMHQMGYSGWGWHILYELTTWPLVSIKWYLKNKRNMGRIICLPVVVTSSEQ